MTDKKKTEGVVNLPGKGIWENNFDPRIQSIPSYLPGEKGSSFGLMRGYMVTAFPKSKTSGENRFYMLNFLYNPSTVSVNHSTDAANQNAAALTQKDGDPNYAAAFGDAFYDDLVIGVSKMLSVGAVLSSPVIERDMIYFGSTDGNVYAIS